jgi:hypothetical protein
MANIVNKRQSFGQVGVESEGGCHRACDLSYFEGVREAIAKVIGIARSKDLRLCLQAAKSAGMDDAVTVARICVAIRVLRL